MPPDLVGSATAAEILGWSLSTVKRKARNDTIPVAVKMDGETGAYLFERATLEAIRDNETSAA